MVEQQHPIDQFTTENRWVIGNDPNTTATFYEIEAV